MIQCKLGMSLRVFEVLQVIHHSTRNPTVSHPSAFWWVEAVWQLLHTKCFKMPISPKEIQSRWGMYSHQSPTWCFHLHHRSTGLRLTFTKVNRGLQGLPTVDPTKYQWLKDWAIEHSHSMPPRRQLCFHVFPWCAYHTIWINLNASDIVFCLFDSLTTYVCS